MTTKTKAVPVPKLSPSSLGLLRGPEPCTRCFWDYINGDKRPQGPMPSITFGLDGALKSYLDSHRDAKTTPAAVAALPGEQRLWGTPAEMKKLRGWIAARIETAHGPCELRGKLDDLLVGADGRFSPFDAKTKGKRPEDAGAVYYRHQLDLYALLLERNGMPPTAVGYLWYWWPVALAGAGGFGPGDSIAFDSKIHQLDTNTKRALDLLDEGMRLLSGTRPDVKRTSASDSTPACVWCRFRLR